MIFKRLKLKGKREKVCIGISLTFWGLAYAKIIDFIAIFWG